MEEEYGVDGRGFEALWLLEDDCTGPLSVEIDLPWHQDALDLNYPKVADTQYQLPDGYQLVVPPEGSIVMECPPGHVVVYIYLFEFGLLFPLDSFLMKILNAFHF